MKSLAFVFALTFSTMTYSATAIQSIEAYIAQPYMERAAQQKLDQDITWLRLMYADKQGQSEVSYAGYFLSPNGQVDLKQELQANIQALFQPAAPNQSLRCRFPARSHWLMQQLHIQEEQLPTVTCPELDDWIGQIKPYKATLIYATDFMGNPSSMFGHTLLRLDPKDQKQLNLVSYAVNYAATVTNGEGWSFAWNGLTGQYPGEYSLMPYYRKVKEYGDMESRDLWEYELSLTPEETRFLVQHIWEMKHVSFPYYFVSDNCAYRLLGLMDLVRPALNLKQQFKVAAIPVETMKAIERQGLVKETIYRPALETQLLSQARQHGKSLAKVAHQVAFAEPIEMSRQMGAYQDLDKAKILEMAYDYLYLQFIGRKVEPVFAQPRLRQLLSMRSEIDLEKQRQQPQRPKVDPTQAHDARHFSVNMGELQGEKFVELGHRQAYHDLIDPQGGFRTGTQLLFWDGSIQYRDDELKLEHFDVLSVNSYNPMTPFKTPLSWGFNLGWKQEALDQKGQFSEQEQHGIANLQVQMGYSYANPAREHLCYMQLQNHIQAGKALDQGWRVGMGPTIGCQNIWSDHINSLLQLELPYWGDSKQWQLKLNTQWQYVLNPQNVIRFNWQYQQQDHKDWMKTSLGYVRFF
ncbi:MULTISPECIES: DUF4105 domain-containing protein [unclassified Acinetobacter]|uniref:Lnb N-terminal periplasmic domain-containing protein n=1 Tax=unclassified Acinetobacter TaxID=196816 RepID=UPI000A337090|nr:MULTISPECIES: DUF4105 domain-containing protein [unclassified Acinetobacter]MDD2945634.1 DUF4105 domain-containing protein [Acinetobacter sp.]OTG74794.1 hypothetical protein B9T38_00800 [Acinetobacter sp. ANC 4218]